MQLIATLSPKRSLTRMPENEPGYDPERVEYVIQGTYEDCAIGTYAVLEAAARRRSERDAVHAASDGESAVSIQDARELMPEKFCDERPLLGPRMIWPLRAYYTAYPERFAFDPFE